MKFTSNPLVNISVEEYCGEDNNFSTVRLYYNNICVGVFIDGIFNRVRIYGMELSELQRLQIEMEEVIVEKVGGFRIKIEDPAT